MSLRKRRHTTEQIRRRTSENTPICIAGRCFASFFDEDDIENLRISIQLGGIHPGKVSVDSAFEIMLLNTDDDDRQRKSAR
jgi:hypothetical protein